MDLSYVMTKEPGPRGMFISERMFVQHPPAVVSGPVAVLLLQTPLLCGPLLLKGCSAGSWCVCTPVVVQEAEVAPARFPL